MLKTRIADLDFRQEARQKVFIILALIMLLFQWTKIENEKQEVQEVNNRFKAKLEQMQSETKDLKLQLAN